MKASFLLRLIVFGLAQLSILSSAVAEDCSFVDLAPLMGPVRDQGDIGWCYANAASDLLGFRYRSELHGQPISAFYTALSFNDAVYNRPLISRFIPPDLAEGGYISIAMKNAMLNGFCPRLDDGHLSENHRRISLKDKLQEALKLKQLYDRDDVQGFRAQLAAVGKTDSFLNLLSKPRLFEILRQNTSANFLMAVADELCGDRKMIPKETAHGWVAVAPPHSRFTERLMAIIDRQIDLHNPVGVDYYDTFFKGWDVKPDPSQKHASVIVGRAMRGGQCYYKLRNSWGPVCNYENPLFKQDLDCDHGYLWIPKAKYGDYLFAVTYLEPRRGSLFKDFLASGFGIPF